MTTRTLGNKITVRGRFARSINVEHDHDASAIEGYLPTGRSLDVTRRFARSLVEAEAVRAFSITGPYGSGKSSLAIFLDALCAGENEPERAVAKEVLEAADPESLALIEEGRQALGASEQGFLRAVIAAQREPILFTILRALDQGVRRFPDRRQLRGRKALGELQAAIEDPDCTTPSSRDVVAVIEDLTERAPILLIVDEFGKNLEAFVESRSDADLYLLQALAESAQGDQGVPLFMFTLQHLAFEDYVTSASEHQRREWVKVQGRFEDIPYVDTPRQTRTLLSSVFQHPTRGSLTDAISEWARTHVDRCRSLGLSDLAEDKELLSATFPLHPLTLHVLPELCARYGQNERTLFSFLASKEPQSVASMLTDTRWNSGALLPTVGLEQVYEYFIESAPTMVGASRQASRWLEIETRIRDAQGLSDLERVVLKVVGLLNLVSTGGTLRASPKILEYALEPTMQQQTLEASRLHEVLRDLEERGLLIYRDFADEYRIWQGSDFDLKTAIENARRRVRDEPIAQLLDRIRPLDPLVASRHSQQTGTTRIFNRRFTDQTTSDLAPPDPFDPFDGLLLYVLDASGDLPEIQGVGEHSAPVVLAIPSEVSELVEAAREAAALAELLEDEELELDWVARRELVERASWALQRVDQQFQTTFGIHAEDNRWLAMAGGDQVELSGAQGPSAALSEACDVAYAATPPIRNEMLNRTELTSQGAKARRLLIEAMIEHDSEERFGIEGYGPERAMYEAVLRTPSLHRRRKGGWKLAAPKRDSEFAEVWKTILSTLRSAKRGRLGLEQLNRVLTSPPHGLKAGAVPVFTIAALLVYADEIAIYEHGTFKPVLTADLAERLIKNPAHFEFKHFGSKTGARREFVETLADAFDVTPGYRKQRVGTVLSVVGHLVTIAQHLPKFARRTRRVSEGTASLRDVLYAATEPDVLLFEAVPSSLGFEAISASKKRSATDRREVADSIVAAVGELERVYPSLLEDISAELASATGTPLETLRKSLEVRAKDLESGVLDQRLRGFMTALTADSLGNQEWLEYVAMTVHGSTPENWLDDDFARYQVSVAELGGALRRLEALKFDTRAKDEQPFDAFRITLTRSDGAEEARVITLDETVRQQLRDLTADVLALASEHTVSEAEARDALLALLGERMFTTRDELAARIEATDQPTTAEGKSHG